MRRLSESGFKYGIEYEFALISRDKQFVDFTNTTFDQLEAIVAELPTYPEDYPGMRVGDLGIKAKRWYIEGFERFSDSGEYLRTDIKGPEIRTPISKSIDEAVQYLEESYDQFSQCAGAHGYHPVAIGCNPYQTEFVPTPALNDWEIAHRSSPEEQTAYIHMMTYGPDVSLSHTDMSVEEMIDAARKLTYYSPYIIPWSFASPFYEGTLWGGLSRRNYYRTGARPAALVFVPGQDDLIESVPTLTEVARLPAERGRIEFKAFDSVDNRRLYGSLLALVKGIILDTTLTGRATTPDAGMHQFSAMHGFGDDRLREQSEQILMAAKSALPPDEHRWLEPLERSLEARVSPANVMIEQYKSNPNIIQILEAIHGQSL